MMSIFSYVFILGYLLVFFFAVTQPTQVVKQGGKDDVFVFLKSISTLQKIAVFCSAV